MRDILSAPSLCYADLLSVFPERADKAHNGNKQNNPAPNQQTGFCSHAASHAFGFAQTDEVRGEKQRQCGAGN